MRKETVYVAAFMAFVLGCAKQPVQTESAELPRIADYPCVCTNRYICAVVSNEVVRTEDIGKRYEVQPHHYYPTAKDSKGRKFRIEVMVGYQKQYLREGEPTDTSISNETCFCGGPWEFTTNGYFNCKRITSRTGLNCCECGGAIWETNVTTYAEKEAAND